MLSARPLAETLPAETLPALRRRALSLGTANAIDYALQFLLPVVLVRCLAPADFGQYRLIWLLVMTVMVLAPLSMPQSLYYFLPRADAATRRLHIHHTLIYLAAAGLAGGLLLGPWNPLLPAEMRLPGEWTYRVPLLVLLFTLTFLLDMLPTIEERVHWQAALTLALSLLRSLALGLGAWLTGALDVVLDLLLGVMLLKLGLLLAYTGRMHGLGGPWFRREIFFNQFHHAAPLGLSAGLYGLRAQADQWVAASLFAVEHFAAFSVAAVLGPMVNLCRQSVNHVFLPTMSRLHAAGDLRAMAALNSRANVMVATLAFPLLAFAFAFAEDIITVVYTERYLAAAPVMRVYVLGLAAFAVELSSLLLLLREGRFALRLNFVTLLGSIAVSLVAAQHFGLAGAALGSTLALFADRYATLRRISAATGIAIGQLQDWPRLGQRLLLAIGAAAGAAALVAALGGALGGALLAGMGALGIPQPAPPLAAAPLTTPLLRLSLGAAVLSLLYGAGWMLAPTPEARALAAPPLP